MTLAEALDKLSDAMVADHVASHMTCTELEALVAVFRAVGGDDVGATWLNSHYDNDDEPDDLHYMGDEEPSDHSSSKEDARNAALTEEPSFWFAEGYSVAMYNTGAPQLAELPDDARNDYLCGLIFGLNERGDADGITHALAYLTGAGR